jgi:hypothetical protein
MHKKAVEKIRAELLGKQTKLKDALLSADAPKNE